MPSEYARVRAALIRIRRLAGKSWRNSKEPLAIHLQKLKFHISEERLKRVFPREPVLRVQIPPSGDSKHFTRKAEGLLMPSIGEKSCLMPILCMDWTFDDAATERGAYRLFLLSCDEFEVNNGGEPFGPPVAFGFRFDDREASKEWSFSHCQVSDIVTPYQNLMQLHHRWVPAEVPRIPLASCPSGAETILVCILAGLYGLKSELLAYPLGPGEEAKGILRCLGGSRQ